MPKPRALLVLPVAASVLWGCGSKEVTSDSMHEALQERADKAKALDAKEGKKETGISYTEPNGQQ